MSSPYVMGKSHFLLSVSPKTFADQKCHHALVGKSDELEQRERSHVAFRTPWIGAFHNNNSDRWHPSFGTSIYKAALLSCVMPLEGQHMKEHIP